MKAGIANRVLKAAWRLFAGFLLIAVGVGFVFVAWSVYELRYYGKYGAYNVDIGSVSAFSPKYSYRAGEGEPMQLRVAHPRVEEEQDGRPVAAIELLGRIADLQ